MTKKQAANPIVEETEGAMTEAEATNLTALIFREIMGEADPDPVEFAALRVIVEAATSDDQAAARLWRRVSRQLELRYWERRLAELQS